MLIAILAMINPSLRRIPPPAQAYFSLEIRAFFRLISRWTRLRPAQPVAGGIMSFGGPICLWCEAADFGLPMASLVYPSVYPTKVDGSESKEWRGLRRVFRFRPSHHLHVPGSPRFPRNPKKHLRDNALGLFC